MVGKRIAGISLIGLIALGSSGCGGSDGGSSYLVGGSVTGLLSGTTVTLQDNGANNTLVSANAAFSFSTPIGNGASYSVTVLSQPVGEVCTVTSGSGTIASANVSVGVMCTPNSYSIGGAVSGLLAGNSVTLSVNGGGSSVAVTANGAFKLGPVVSGTNYAVAVASQPTGQTCTISNGTGTLAGADVTNVAVACSVQSYQINVSVMGQPTIAGLVLQDNGGDNLTVNASGTYSFSAPIADQMPYAVTILSQPSGTTCTVANGSGTVSGANITNVMISCPWHVAYFAQFLNSQVGEYFIDGKTGALYARNFNGADVGYFANSGALDPQSRFLYVASGNAGYSGGPGTEGAGQVFVFSIDPASGALTAVAGSPFAWDEIPLSITVAPNGKYVYTANGSAGTISAYSVNTATGALTEVAGSPFASGSSVTAVTITSDTAFLYLASESGTTGNGEIYGYSIEATTGALVAITGSPFAAAVPLGTVMVDPATSYVYAVDTTTNGLLAYSISPGTGILSSVAGSPFAAASAGSFVFDPTGKYLYTSGGISIYVDVADAATGAVAPLSGSPFSSGLNNISGPDATVVDPSGNFVYCFTTQLELSSPDNVIGYSVNVSTGALTGLGDLSESDMSGFRFMAIAALP